MSLIEKLTPEQEALIPVYRDKWRAIALSTERIDREKAAEAVKAAYAIIPEPEPTIIFCDSPYASLCLEIDLQLKYSNDKLYSDIEYLLFAQLKNQLGYNTLYVLNRRLNIDINRINQIEFELAVLLDRELKINCLRYFVDGSIRLDGLLRPYSLFEFCIYVLKCNYNQEIWEVLQNIYKHCGRIFAFDNVCMICDRPLHLRFDNQNRLHAEGEPAIEFIDGFSLYSYHGVTLPEKYGKIHPQQWQSQWLLSEENAELRRVLIQGIGYARICQELQAIELDTWAEYTLLKIEADVDEEPIYLLKMTCPSTQFIHALRVPPEIKSAREAVRWVNWGVDPEQFGVQT
ncbi:hypothetical protein IQ276_011125 [Desmonostoc muscorum LEGE 12446]|uniref:DUF6745 domain-containing protein n=1 Tax=Desmonostoc muscorum LEGE 12446 TaxID=1828758 RepID=A0A8J7CZP4_DESMC|nr:hypothetical protein [Desmonostoc muscorum]MCF2146992.1 hypothetical protein [Desmonostoc muscorum LEGE 12446]